MAERLKDSFGVDVAERIAAMIETVHPTFDSRGFIAESLDGYEDLELTQRARQISVAMSRHLGEDKARALEILIASLGPEIDDPDAMGMETFLYLPHVFFVAMDGLDEFELAMRAQWELTKRFSAEFSIRAFIERHPTATLDRLRAWARDPNVHVRRLVSEGTRPRLPWAPRLRLFMDDPAPVIELLDLLRTDPEPYVRRSVANNVNDIAKDHPEMAVATIRRWLAADPPIRRDLARHALRTLIRRGHPGALAVLGFSHGSPADVHVTIDPPRPSIGGTVRLEALVANPTDQTIEAVVDFRIHFVKARGRTSPKVFKGGVVRLVPGGDARIRRSVSLAQHTTRTHYPGSHLVEVLVNGEARPGGTFDLA